MKKTAELRTIDVKDLKPAEYNPRKKLKPGDKEYEKIKNSITEFGFADPLVVNADMTIIGGHQRLSVAMDLGYKEVPCAVVDVDKTREKALNIALNKITGAWDEDLLADLFKDKRGYPICNYSRKEEKSHRPHVLHRYLINPEGKFDIDHISGDKMDNRRSNLRICTHQENCFNQKIRNTNSSGYIGVAYSKNAKKYEAYINKDGKKMHLGLFKSAKEAAVERDKAAKMFFGEYASLNFGGV